MQERLSAVQAELKRESAAAEQAREQALSVVRRQTALREARTAFLFLLFSLFHPCGCHIVFTHWRRGVVVRM